MSVGVDIEEAIRENGVSFSVLGEDGSYTSGEYTFYELPEQATRPLVREFLLEAWFFYNTTVATGDIVRFEVPESSKQHYLVTNRDPDIFENDIIKYDGVLYKCNVSGELWRPSGEFSPDAQTYRVTQQFETIKYNMWGTSLNDVSSQQGVQESVKNIAVVVVSEDQELLVPAKYGTREFDRFWINSGEYYMVKSVIRRRFPGVDLLRLGVDNR